MIIFDIKLGSVGVMATKEAGLCWPKVQREGNREVALDLPWVSLIFSA